MASPEHSKAPSDSLSRSSSMSSYFNSLEEPMEYLEEVKLEVEELAKILEANARVNNPEGRAKFITKNRPKPNLVNVNNEYLLRREDFEELKRIEEAERLATKLSVNSINIPLDICMHSTGSAGMNEWRPEGAMDDVMTTMDGQMNGGRMDDHYDDHNVHSGPLDAPCGRHNDHYGGAISTCDAIDGSEYFGAINTGSTSGTNGISGMVKDVTTEEEIRGPMDKMTGTSPDSSKLPLVATPTNMYHPEEHHDVKPGHVNRALFNNPGNNSFLLKANCSSNSTLNIKSEEGIVELEYSPSVKVSLNFKSQTSDFFKHSNLFKRWRDQNFGPHLNDYHRIAGTDLDTDRVSQN